MSTVWKTKWGARRVRHDPPTLAEACAAAQDLTEDVEAQTVIAAELMGVSVEDARAELRRLATRSREPATMIAPTRGKNGTRTVVVERKTSRRFARPLEDRSGYSRLS